MSEVDALVEAVAEVAATSPGQETSDAAIDAAERAIVELVVSDPDAYVLATAEELAAALLEYLPETERARLEPLVLESARAYEENSIIITGAAPGIEMLGADPVVLSTGTFVQDVLDFTIAGGVGFELGFRRRYRSGAFICGPMGASWDHSLNLWIREDAGGEVLSRSTGGFREDRYRRHRVHGYFVPPAGVHDILESVGTSYRARSPDGLRTTYERAPNFRYHRATRIETRTGHHVDLTYDGDGRLDRVIVSSSARWLQLRHDDEGRLVQATVYPVTCHRDDVPRTETRVWHYTYDDFGDLVQVHSPATEEQSSGFVTRYEYSSQRTGGVGANQLLRIIDARGLPFVENEYGRSQGSVSFNRLVRQQAVSGEYQLDFYDAFPDVAVGEDPPDPAEAPASKTVLRERNGHVVDHYFNEAGHLLATSQRVLDGCSVRGVVTCARFNRDGVLVAEITGEGRVKQRLFGRESYYHRFPASHEDDPVNDPNLTATERSGFGNLLAEVERAAKRKIGDVEFALARTSAVFQSIYTSRPEDIIRKFTYEARFHRLASASDSRYTNTADPTGQESAAYSATLTRFSYEQLAPWNLLRTVYPDTTYPSSLPAGGATGRTNVHEAFTSYDARGRLTGHRDAEGTTRTRSYFAASAGPREGFLRSQTADPGGLALTLQFEVNEVGAPIAITNARGVRVDMRVDEYARVIRSTRVSTGHAVDTSYDCDGRVLRVESDCIAPDGSAHPEGRRVASNRYDAAGNLLEERLETTQGATPAIITCYRYDDAGRLARVTRPRGSVTSFEYDERGRLRELIRGCCTELESDRRYSYDDDGLLVAIEDGEGGVTRHLYDAFGNRVRTIDAAGNQVSREYDKAGNVVAEWQVERRADGSYVLLDCARYQYDERRRLVSLRTAIFDAPVPVQDPVLALTGELAVEVAAGRVTWAETQHFLDNLGRVFRTVYPNGGVERCRFDGAGRMIGRTLTSGTVESLTLDGNGNVTREERSERVTGVGAAFEAFVVAHAYDDADRRSASVDALGNRTEWGWDSLGRAVHRIDSLGNERAWELDLLGFRRVERWRLTADGLGGSAPAMPGLVECVSHFDSHGNLIEYVDPKGLGAVTRYEYDLLDRQVEVVFPDGGRIAQEYDKDDRLRAVTNGRGMRIDIQVDRLGRVTRRNVAASAQPSAPSAETYAAFEYDARGRVRSHENDWVRVDIARESRGLATVEAFSLKSPLSSVGIGAPLVLRRRFDAEGNRVAMVYSDGTEIVYRHDRAGRLRRIRCMQAGGGALPHHTGSIAEFSYTGPRLRASEHGNGTGSRWSYDGGARAISIAHGGPGWQAEYQQLFDGVGNVRLRRDQVSGQATTVATFGYDSQYQLTEIRGGGAAAFNPATLRPPQPGGAALGQTQIDPLLGGLAQGAVAPTFQYDLAGNRLLDASGAVAVTYASNGANAYAAVNNAAWTHDADGTTTSTGAAQFSFDALSRLAQIGGAGGVTDVYVDGLGRLCAREVQGALCVFLHDGDEIAEQHGAVDAIHVGMNRRDSCVCSFIAAAGEAVWSHRDGLGSVRSISGVAGSRLGLGSYAAFGVEIDKLPPWYGFRHGGRVSLSDDVLYSRRRVLLSKHGRFLQRDPSGYADGYNLYAYAGNNPLSFVDPRGLEKQGVADAGPTISEDRFVVIGFSGLTWPHEEYAGQALPLADESRVVTRIVASATALHPNVKALALATDLRNSSGRSMAADRALQFALKNADPATRLLVYGYSMGGERAMELASRLAQRGVDVELLITVDSAMGPMQANNRVPSNVKENVNYWHEHLGVFEDSPIRSHGAPNVKESVDAPTVIRNEEIQGVTHGSIDEATEDFVKALIELHMQSSVARGAP